jgi:hypothetical protein
MSAININSVISFLGSPKKLRRIPSSKSFKDSGIPFKEKYSLTFVHRVESIAFNPKNL